ncbi:MAG: hypothetical protein BWY06_02701 [Candidatus Latescibacteria bacterium ADurb.Bin168]|nr:MAG: hypothetical protein BWY06_02701 [Candidatus Latescibacteria bacterium ADurb.Bin168]
MGQRYLGGIHVGKCVSDGSGLRDKSGHPEIDVVSTLVADNLKRHSGHDCALNVRLPGRPFHLASEGGQEPAHGRAEPHARYIHFETQAVDRILCPCFQIGFHRVFFQSLSNPRHDTNVQTG